jgi:hypothetical protein
VATLSQLFVAMTYKCHAKRRLVLNTRKRFDEVHRTYHNWPVTLLSELTEAVALTNSFGDESHFAGYSTLSMVMECSVYDPDADVIKAEPSSAGLLHDVTPRSGNGSFIPCHFSSPNSLLNAPSTSGILLQV